MRTIVEWQQSQVDCKYGIINGSARLNGQLTYFNKPHVLLIEMFIAGTRTSRDDRFSEILQQTFASSQIFFRAQ